MEEGYECFKVKIKLEYDYELLKEICKEFLGILLMVDVNLVYILGDMERLK